MYRQSRVTGAFTLVELLVVIGIIAVLLAILLPALNRAQAQSMQVQCESNLRQDGLAMLAYADQNSGYLFPDTMGWSNANVYLTTPNDNSLVPSSGMIGTVVDYVLAQPDQWQSYTYNVWTTKVFNGVWNPPIMTCPTDATDPPPNARHTYILNDHLAELDAKYVKYGTPLPNDISPSDAILMGEKVSIWGDYYMNAGDYGLGKVDEFRHGSQLGSNYLMLDMHVEAKIITAENAQYLLDPWDLPGTATALPDPNQ
jgi:prepilin-type N-terminal cleavage/methylation domain-containing protein